MTGVASALSLAGRYLNDKVSMRRMPQRYRFGKRGHLETELEKSCGEIRELSLYLSSLFLKSCNNKKSLMSPIRLLLQNLIDESSAAPIICGAASRLRR